MRKKEEIKFAVKCALGFYYHLGANGLEQSEEPYLFDEWRHARDVHVDIRKRNAVRHGAFDDPAIYEVKTVEERMW